MSLYSSEFIELSRNEIILLLHCLRAWNNNTYDNLQDVGDLLCKDPNNTWLNEFHGWLKSEYELGVDLEKYLERFSE